MIAMDRNGSMVLRLCYDLVTLSKKQAAETANPTQSTPPVASAEPTQSVDNKGGEQ